MILQTPNTTGIGSLPHHNIDAALDFSFRSGVPYLPQIPIRNPWEFMIAQALEGMPGLQVDAEGTAVLDFNVWVGRTHSFDDRLLEAFVNSDRTDAFAAFEPSAAASSSWQPFLWELSERKVPVAKIQLAGPLTAQWVLRLKDGGAAQTHPEITVQIFRLVLARAIAMSRRLEAQGVKPILFLDEPGLYGWTPTNPRHVMGLQELKVMVQTLKKENVLVGLHCCSNTDWNAVLQLGLDILSLDVELSLEKVLDTPSAREFILNGGRFAFGVVPTTVDGGKRASEPEDLFTSLLGMFGKFWSNEPSLTKQALTTGLFTPACGLALHNPADAEIVQTTLEEFKRCLSTFRAEK